jgi:hypothetical protein
LGFSKTTALSQLLFDAGGFFWFVFLSAKENEHKIIGAVNRAYYKGDRQRYFLQKRRTAVLIRFFSKPSGF